MAEKKEISTKLKGWWNSLDKTKVLIGVFASLIAASLILYMCYFGGGISSEHKRWSEFGDYIAGVAGILNVTAFVVLTISLHKIEREREDRSKKVERERENRSIRLHAEEFIIKKIQDYLGILDGLYIPYQKAIIKTQDIEGAKYIANETFEVLQPLMTYLYYLQKLDFLPRTTVELIKGIHEYLFTASDKFLCYWLEIDGEDGKPVKAKDVLKTYRDIYRFLEELDVKMTADIADFAIKEDEKTNYGEKYPDNIEKKTLTKNQ